MSIPNSGRQESINTNTQNHYKTLLQDVYQLLLVLAVASSQSASHPQEQNSSMSSVIMYVLQRTPLVP